MAFNYISFFFAKRTQTIQSLFFFVIIQSLSYLCSHSAINQSLTRSSVLGLSANPLLHPVSLHKSYICTHFRFLLQWINSSHKMAKRQLIKYMESRIPHAKLGFATTAKCSTPTGKQSTKLPKVTRTMKRSLSMTSGDRTKIFMLSLLGLSSKHNQPVPLKSNSVQQISKEEIISPLEPLLHDCFNRRNLLIC